MGFLLEDRAALLRDFYALTGTSSSDDALTEYDAEASERAHRMIQHGLWDAQEYVLSYVDPDRWLTRSAALSFTTAADDTHYAALPDDFLRLAGDESESALVEADGTRWGTLLPGRLKGRASGRYYWLQNERVYLAKNASPPTLYMDYHHRHATLDSNEVALDFPILDRPLIPAFAAYRAAMEAWLPGGPEMLSKIQANLMERKVEAKRRGRRTREPNKTRAPSPFGTHWFL